MKNDAQDFKTIFQRIKDKKNLRDLREFGGKYVYLNYCAPESTSWKMFQVLKSTNL